MARAFTLKSAEILLYPKAIGSEPEAPELDSSAHWQRVMQGHSAANIIPVVASNRIGVERGTRFEIIFYGSSFITAYTGCKIVEAANFSESHIVSFVDLDSAADYRCKWGVFRDRGVDLYKALETLEGKSQA